jgi:sialate O-acetylesterase
VSTDRSPWPAGQRAAVSLTYDDALPCHHEFVAPALEERGLRATFYVTLAPLLQDRGPLEPWKRIARQGHELGNHSIWHPCRRAPDDKPSWIPDEYNLWTYTLRRLRDELALANDVLGLIDGQAHRTYGNTCHQIHVGPDAQRVDIAPVIEELFLGARGQADRLVDPAAPEFANLGCMNGDRKDLHQLRAMVDQALQQGAWLIFCFHGVGENTHSRYAGKDMHAGLFRWLAERKSDIWTAPVVDVARYLRSPR